MGLGEAEGMGFVFSVEGMWEGRVSCGGDDVAVRGFVIRGGFRAEGRCGGAGLRDPAL